jgi:hypothetical protein
VDYYNAEMALLNKAGAQCSMAMVLSFSVSAYMVKWIAQIKKPGIGLAPMPGS